MRSLGRYTGALLTALTLLGAGAVATRAQAKEVEMTVGTLAPDFSLVDQGGVTRTLSAYRNHWVVLYFYPKDDTPGCTTEACQFRDDYLAVTKLGAEVLGVSVDNRDSHAEFAKKYHLPFPLLADAGGKVAREYGALWSLGFVRFARRNTFIIDPAGRIAKIYRNVSPKTHSREVIEDLKALEKAGG